MPYDHISLEKKWQKFWEENQVFKTENPISEISFDKSSKMVLESEKNPQSAMADSSFQKEPNKPKKYILDMFPYPSGAGLHVGHPKGYTATDIVSRYYHAKGYNVLHPMGFDAFGLPAENYAIKTGTHPAITTAENIATFTSQMKNLGFSYDWDRMVDTTDPEYYKWTQWIFLELFKRGLAYEQDLPINYCPSCKTGLANEEVLSDNTCDRCGTRVERRPIRQWVLRITEYAERLLADIDTLDWPEGIKEMQRNWIGKSEGCEFRMMKEIDTKKGRLPLSVNGGVHNGLAKSSSMESIFGSLQKVNTKIKFSGNIEGQIIGVDNKNISFRSKDILAHFRGKSKKEFIQRSGFLGTVFSLMDRIHFDQENHGYFFYKNIVIKIVLGQQTNGNYFVKSYYVADTLTEEYRKYSDRIKKPTALLLHGWDNVEKRTNWGWMPSTKTELEKIGYEVIMVQLPGNNAPDLEKQLAFLDQYKSRLDERSVIIGHSMGGFLGMHFVANLDIKIGKLICVAPIFNGLIDNVDWSDKVTNWDIGMSSMKNIYDEEKIQKNTNDWRVFLSENDPWILHSDASKYFESVGAHIISIPDAGHFCEGDGYATFPELLEEFDHIRVYTTRVDTVFGMTYAVLAPDHPKVESFITDDYRTICEQYIEGVQGKADIDRTNDGKEKTGVFTGSYVINPYNGESVPLWIADFVLGHYGTGALMAVPAHDERDFEFAQKYDLPIKQSIGQKFGKELSDTQKRDRVGAIIMRDDTILCEKLSSKDTKFNGEYLLIGGGIEEGESPTEALNREIMEELGVSAFKINEQIGVYSTHWFSLPKQENRSMTHHIFAIELDGTDISENTDETELQWVPVDKLLIDLDQHDKKDQSDAIRRFINKSVFTDDGFLVQSGENDSISSSEARKILSEKAETEGFGQKKVNYKLRDWLYSRQRYWGEPIPLIHISREDYAKLPRVKNLEDAKSSEASIFVSSGGTKDLPQSGTDSSQAQNDKNEEYLVIDGKIFSGIYEGITGKIIIDSHLPLTLPEVERYEPAGDGQSPLATVPDWVNVKLADNLSGKRETNTMPQWGGSCWYYLRYMDSKNPDTLASKEALEYWQNVDEYVGGAEHAVLHLLYARFWHKVLYDIGVVPTLEPFQKLTNVGMILAYAYERSDGGLVAVDLVEEVPSPLLKEGTPKGGEIFDPEKNIEPQKLDNTNIKVLPRTIFVEKETGKEVKQVVAKMSKSLKNVVNPNDIVTQYGADTLRLYEMSMSGFTDAAPWNPDAIIGVRRFLDKAYAAFAHSSPKIGEAGRGVYDNNTPPLTPPHGGGEYLRAKDDMKAMKLLHKTIKKVGEDIIEYKFNTAISALMILLNEGIPTDEEFALEWKEKFATLLHPFAPHMAEELWKICHPELVSGSRDTLEDAETSSAGLSIYNISWPDYDDFMLIDDEVTIAVQVNGKLRGTLVCLNGVMQDEVSSLAHEDPGIFKWIEGKILVKEIFIPNKMLSIVVKESE